MQVMPISRQWIQIQLDFGPLIDVHIHKAKQIEASITVLQDLEYRFPNYLI